MRALTSALALALLAALPACQCSRDPFAGGLADNVGESFGTCNEAEIRFRAAKHNVQLAFAPCGNNNFSAYRWSPDGLRIYFQLVMSSYVMDADAANKRTVGVPLPQPVSGAVWLNSTRLAVPVVADEDSDALRMAVYDLPATSDDPEVATTGQVLLHALPAELAEVGQLQRGNGPAELFFAGRTGDDAPWTLWRFDTAEGRATPVSGALAVPFTTFTYTPSQHAASFGHEGSVRVITTDGQTFGAWEHADRGVLSPDGRWMALEHLGSPVSVYAQRAWDELSEQAREREKARAERFAEGLPEYMERTVRPPTLSLAPVSGEGRWTLTAFHGDHFQWYDAADGWGSFFLWGFESKQYKRNVALIDLNPHLLAVEEGTDRYGMEPFQPPTDTRAAE